MSPKGRYRSGSFLFLVSQCGALLLTILFAVVLVRAFPRRQPVL